MKIKYQIISLGCENEFSDKIIDKFFLRIKELGLQKEMIKIIDNSNFESEYKGNAPAFCLYYGGDYEDVTHLERLINDATLILPMVNSLANFNQEIPELLRGVNGTELNSDDDLDKIVSLMLEGFGLLRTTRKVFISYKRSESSSVAIQLYEELEKSGFDVFLDTHSIRPGEPFQEELWHRMTDSDVVVILNTPGFLESQWCEEELAEASAKNIGIVQLIWPNHKLDQEAYICTPVYMKDEDFVDSSYKDAFKIQLTSNFLKGLIPKIESLRARSLASRQDNLITEFVKVSQKVGADIDLQPERFLIQELENDEERVFIPTVGVPQSYTYNSSEELVQRIRDKKIDSIYLLYDHISIRDRWLKHLDWLDNQLSVKTLRILDSEKWLTQNV